MRAGLKTGASVLIAGLCFVSTRAQQPPVFRTTTDTVVVDVSVRDGGSMVTGLTPADFVVSDNGVVQKVDSVEPRAMPLDVTVVADVSGRTKGAWAFRVSAEANVEQVNADVRTIAGILRPEDRIRLIASDTNVQQVFPMQAATTAVVGRLDTQGLSSTYDAIVAAMLKPTEATRRHLVIAWTKRLDTISTNDAATLREVARRSDAVLHVVERDADLSAGGAISPGGTPLNPISMNLTEVYTRSWRPFTRSDRAVLPEVAGLTGGTFHPTGVLRDRNLAEEFKEIFDEFRQGYVLRYSPQRVSRDGWHEIVVTLPKTPGADIRARRGYAIESGAPPVPASAGPRALTMPPGDIWKNLNLTRVITNFKDSRNPTPAFPRRAALDALDLIAAGLDKREGGSREAALDLVKHYVPFVRAPLSGDAFECGWYGAVLAALEGALESTFANDLLLRALRRCPDDGRLLLARAFVSDQLASSKAMAAGNGRVALAAPVVDAILTEYNAAARWLDVAPEAYVRAAWLAYRFGRLGQAATYLEAVTPPTNDRAVDYLGELVRGKVLTAQGKIEAAAAAYRAALAIRPGEQSARVGLMMLLLRQGDRAQAESLAEAVQTNPGTAIDPWWLYWLGDYRIQSALHANLRALDARLNELPQ